jgi:5-hydroxyisourate hydrolase-like protein (transthyretin family)
MHSAAEERDSPGSSMLSVVITDAARGRAADGVLCLIERQVDGNWQAVMRGASDSSGTISFGPLSSPGIYRIELDGDPYFAAIGIISLLSRITLTFRIPESCRHSVLHSHIAANSHFSALVRND